MPNRPTVLALLFAATLGIAIGAQGRRGGTPIKPGDECPPGMTETRPGTCQAPEFPPPSILDYRPRSTLVTPETKVPRAKFPVIDIHGHPPGANTADGLARLVGDMDRLNLRVMTVASNVSGERLTQMLGVINASPYKDRFRVFTGVDFRDVGPGWADKAVAQLEADIKAGAVGVGEIGKSFGLSTR
jgi:hypothetical protein